jgi:hypothetical protein
MYSLAQQLSNLGQYQKALEAFQDVLGKRRQIDRYSKLKVLEGGKQGGGEKRRRSERRRWQGRERRAKKKDAGDTSFQRSPSAFWL